jgi:tetratricopeptide (TPR) repeat protein
MKPNLRAVICAVVFAATILALLPAQAQTGNPQGMLSQYISELQKNPNDNALREKIINLVQGMKPVPAIPEEARRYFIEGNALLKAAKEQKGYGLAIDTYRKCLLIAPWWAEAYYNYAVALDLANQFDEAVNVLKLYIATNPGGEESRKAQDKIYEIGAKKKLAAQEREESSPQAAAAREQNKFDDLLKKVDGRRYFYPPPGQDGYAMTIDVSGKFFLLGLIVPPGHANRNDPGGFISYANRSDGRYEIRGRETTVKIPYIQPPPFKEWAVEDTYIISENGDRITKRTLFNTGKLGNDMIFRWQR